MAIPSAEASECRVILDSDKSEHKAHWLSEDESVLMDREVAERLRLGDRMLVGDIPARVIGLRLSFGMVAVSVEVDLGPTEASDGDQQA